MRLPLDHPAWQALYGPYGVEDMPGQLAALSDGWDADIAKDLFWERLHHQETLYPVTFAALPWLMTFGAGWQGEARAELAGFLSHVVSCAFADLGDGPQFSGSVPLGEAGSAYTACDERLRQDFAPEMVALSHWTIEAAPGIAAFCEAAAGDGPEEMSGFALTGSAVLAGAPHLAPALEGAPVHETAVPCPECGRYFHGVPTEEGYRFDPMPDEDRAFRHADAARHRQAARLLAEKMRSGQPRLAAYLDQLATWHCCGD